MTADLAHTGCVTANSTHPRCMTADRTFPRCVISVSTYPRCMTADLTYMYPRCMTANRSYPRSFCFIFPSIRMRRSCSPKSSAGVFLYPKCYFRHVTTVINSGAHLKHRNYYECVHKNNRPNTFGETAIKPMVIPISTHLPVIRYSWLLWLFKLH